MNEYAIQLVEEGRDLEGKYPHTLDDKGRLVFPAAFREAFADGMYVKVGTDGRLVVMTPEGHKHEKLQMLRRSTEARENRFRRGVLTDAQPLHLDSQHRVTLPQEMRRSAGLDRELMVKGNIDHVEIWDRRTFEEFMRRAEAHETDLDEDVPT